MKGAVRTATVFGFTLKLVELSKLKPHEKTINSRLLQVINSIKKKKTLFYPVVVEKSNLVILDGHHRVKAFKFLGIKKIPCLLVDYFSEKIKLLKRKKSVQVSKDVVIERAILENLFPPKTTNHVLEKFKIKYKIGGNKMKNKTKTKTKTMLEGSRLWRNKFAC